MINEIYLQVKRTVRTQAHGPGWPGCNWLADSPEAAMERAVEAIAWHLAWLRKYGRPAPPQDDAILPRLVQQHASTARAGNLIGFFESERQPVRPEEIPGFLDLMACSHSELLELAQNLPEAILSWPPAPGAWSILEVLRHVAAAERWYLTRILDPASLPQFKPNRSVWPRLEAVRALALERLARLSAAECSQVVADSAGELWSARKVFRRYREHEREHTHHILEILYARAHR